MIKSQTSLKTYLNIKLTVGSGCCNAILYLLSQPLAVLEVSEVKCTPFSEILWFPFWTHSVFPFYNMNNSSGRLSDMANIFYGEDF